MIKFDYSKISHEIFEKLGFTPKNYYVRPWQLLNC